MLGLCDRETKAIRRADLLDTPDVVKEREFVVEEGRILRLASGKGPVLTGP